MQRLVATIQHYDWGDRSFIAQLQGRAPSGRPEAELWIGANPNAPSRLESSGSSLAEVINSDPTDALGPAVAARYDKLPFLAKVLAANEPLSIQVHPSLDQARSGFARESAAGVPIGAPERIYRDDNHKPELLCALTAFEMKCGFRAVDATRELFSHLGNPGLDELRERLGSEGSAGVVLRDVLAWLLGADPREGAALAQAAVDAARSAPDGGPWSRDMWWAAEIGRIHPGDVGVVATLLLNHVEMEPGQAVFLGAGNLHSYLRGAGVELMANSDNVIRGGLTSKHVDVEELMSIVDCSPTVPVVQTAVGCLHTFDAPVGEFSLTRVRVRDDTRLQVRGPEILIVTEGIIELTSESGQVVAADAGTPVWIPANEGSYTARGGGVIYRAGVGQP